jgi:hypothetical protein
MIHEQHESVESDIGLQVNAVFGGYHGLGAYPAVVINDDYRFANGFLNHVEPHILLDDYRTAELDLRRLGPAQQTRIMNRQVAANRREGVGHPQPQRK